MVSATHTSGHALTRHRGIIRCEANYTTITMGGGRRPPPHCCYYLLALARTKALTRLLEGSKTFPYYQGLIEQTEIQLVLHTHFGCHCLGSWSEARQRNSECIRRSGALPIGNHASAPAPLSTVYTLQNTTAGREAWDCFVTHSCKISCVGSLLSCDIFSVLFC